MSTDPTNDLINAVREGNVETVKTLIATFGLCSSEKWSNGYDLLCEALRNKHEMMAELLLKSGCSVNRKDNQLSDTPLHLALKNDYKGIVSMLLHREANINAKNHSNETPLHIAMYVALYRTYTTEAACDIVKLLFQKVDDIETLDKNDKTKLYRRVDVNARIKNGRTALHIAASDNYGDASYLSEILIRHGADIEARDDDGLTPLHFICMGDDHYAASMFLVRGANIEAKDKFGRTALHYAAKYNRDNRPEEEIIRLLLEFNADPNATCKESLIPLEYANFSDLLYREVLASKSLDLPVKDSLFKKFLNDFYELSVFESMKSDVAEMKTLTIGDSNVTYYNFLTCGTKQLAVYARNESIVKGLEEGTKYMFDSYLGMINRRQKKMEEIQKKQSLLSSSLKSLHELSGYVLPDLPALEICEYLTIDEMEKLIKADPTAD